MDKHWGPVHRCRCGADVQYQGLRLFDAGTLIRHRCPRFREFAETVQMECLCGCDVDVIGHSRYERGTAKLHVCRRPAAKKATTPLRAVQQSTDRNGNGPLTL